MTLRIFCGTIVTPFEVLEDMLVSIKDCKISAIEHISGRQNCPCPYPHRSDIPDDAYDASDHIVAPGFVDIHVHGAAGYDVLDGTTDSLNGLSLHLARAGITSYIPTAASAPWEQIVSAAKAVSHAMEQGTDGAQVLGLHLEGPFLNPVYTGGQNPDFMREPSIQEFRDKLGGLASVVSVVTIAPELPGAIDLIRYLSVRNIRVSLGHSEALYSDAIAAIDAGAVHATHLFYAMPQLTHDEPGITGAVLADNRVRAELVWDNQHIHPGIARVVINAKRPENVMLVSNGKSMNSTTTLNLAVKNAAQFLPINQAVMTATYVPAYAVGVDREKGSIEVGKDADLVEISKDFNVLEVIIQGQIFGIKR